MDRSERWLVAALALTLLDSGYLSWRYLALRLEIVAPGTSLCSWSSVVDCDRVLVTPEANAFFLPNALLGWGFYLGCLLFWFLGRGLGPQYRFHVVRILTVALGLAALATLRFFWLLVRLPAFCPICPLNHVLTYVALGAAIALYRRTPRPREIVPVLPMLLLVSTCVLLFLTIQLAWFGAQASGALQEPAILR
jgi:uncharacterized membrane protein